MISFLRLVHVLALFTCSSAGGAWAPCGDRCPLHWAPFAGHCYRLVREVKQWQDAEEHCQSLPSRRYGPAHLVSINSEEEQRFIAGYLDRANQVAPSHNVWIGLNDRAHEGQYVWVNGDP